MQYNRTGSNHRAIADLNATSDSDAPADPNIVADLRPGVTFHTVSFCEGPEPRWPSEVKGRMARHLWPNRMCTQANEAIGPN